MGGDPEDVVYDRLAASIRGGCCADRRKPCVEHSMYLDGAENALMAPEVQGAWGDAETLAKVRKRWAVVPWGATDSQMVSFAEDVAALLAGES